ncbi:Major facilitator superfamily protein [Euphorbia peplus]|nr:Major facilitator superfamily protein [Euphorbia peplus]
MDPELEMLSSNKNRKGNWIAFPFILGTTVCFTLASGGWSCNLIVYLIEEFNVKSIDAAQISNWVTAGIFFSPIIGAIIADSFLSSIPVMAISCCVSLLGTLLITLTSVLDWLRPKPCQIGSNICQRPSKFQKAVLYGDLILAFTCIVYIQENVSWGAGYGICLGASFIGLVVFLAGFKFYRHDKPKGNPFIGLAQVAVASIRKMKMQRKVQNLYYQSDATPDQHLLPPKLSNTFRFLNKAAVEVEGDKNPDGSIAKPWRLCTAQQVVPETCSSSAN